MLKRVKPGLILPSGGEMMVGQLKFLLFLIILLLLSWGTTNYVLPVADESRVPEELEKREYLHVMEGKESQHWVLPVKEKYFEITSGFGKRESIFSEDKEFHSGIDIAKPGIEGSKVFAFTEGIVEEVGIDKHGGKYVVLEHPDYRGHFESFYSRFYTLYLHFDEIYVEEGNRVNAGFPIGTVGETGRATGPHLHFETLINREPVDPEKFIDLGGDNNS